MRMTDKEFKNLGVGANFTCGNKKVLGIRK